MEKRPSRMTADQREQGSSSKVSVQHVNFLNMVNSLKKNKKLKKCMECVKSNLNVSLVLQLKVVKGYRAKIC